MSLEDGMRQRQVLAGDRAYLEQRAEAHLDLAAHSTNLNVVHAHYTLADLYLDRLHAAAIAAGQAPLFRWKRAA